MSPSLTQSDDGDTKESVIAGVGLGDKGSSQLGHQASDPNSPHLVGTSGHEFGQFQAKLWTNCRHSGGSWGLTHPQDISCEFIQVLCTLWYRFICPYWLLFLQREEKETLVELKSKIPG